VARVSKDEQSNISIASISANRGMSITFQKGMRMRWRRRKFSRLLSKHISTFLWVKRSEKFQCSNWDASLTILQCKIISILPFGKIFTHKISRRPVFIFHTVELMSDIRALSSRMEKSSSKAFDVLTSSLREDSRSTGNLRYWYWWQCMLRHMKSWAIM